MKLTNLVVRDARICILDMMVALLTVQDVRVGRTRDLDILGRGRREHCCSNDFRHGTSDPVRRVARNLENHATTNDKMSGSSKVDAIGSIAVIDIQD